MIPRDYVTEWRAEAPWVQDFQVEQDLVISRALIEIFSHPVLRCCRSRVNAEEWTAAETARNRDGLRDCGVQPSRFRSGCSVPAVV